MLDQMRNAQRISTGQLVIALTVLLLSVLAVWANDVRKDRGHTAAVMSSTPVFVAEGRESDCFKPPAKVAVEPSGTVLHVRRIRYWKDCATVNVVLPDGRSGHIVLGVGDVSIRPPLN
jgi:hypothetical protein